MPSSLLKYCVELPEHRLQASEVGHPIRPSAAYAKLAGVEGFLVFDYPDENAQAFGEISRWYSEGKLQARETIIPGGLGQAEKALRDIYSGVNTGKKSGLLLGDEKLI